MRDSICTLVVSGVALAAVALAAPAVAQGGFDSCVAGLAKSTGIFESWVVTLNILIPQWAFRDHMGTLAG